MSAIPRPRPDRGGSDPARPARPLPPRPVARPARGAAPASADPRLRSAPDPPFVERRHRRRSRWSQWLYRPLPLDAFEQRAGRVSRRAWPWLRVVLAALAVVALALGAWWWAWVRAPLLTPRDRAEALCFQLAESPGFAPPMHVESGAAMVRGRFSPDTPAGIAIRAAMRVTPDMVLSEQPRHVGDYDVTVMWLRLPTAGDGHHWLVLGWMEGSDLAMCSFRFAGDPAELSADQMLWGRRLTDRILQPEYFQTGVVPDIRWRAIGGDPLPSFGPPAGH